MHSVNKMMVKVSYYAVNVLLTLMNIIHVYVLNMNDLGTSEKVEVHSQRLSPLFSVPLYKTYVIPELIKMFHCHDYHIRMILLTYFPLYMDLFEKNDLEEVIFPQVLNIYWNCNLVRISFCNKCPWNFKSPMKKNTTFYL